METDVFKLSKFLKVFSLSFYFFGVGFFLNAQEIEEKENAESNEENELDIFGEDSEEKWQILEWEEQNPESVLKYEITIQEIVLDKKTKKQTFVKCRNFFTENNETSLKIKPILPPGNYRYKITTFDLIGFPSAESEWKDFSIFRAFKPIVKDITANVTFNSTIYLEEYNDGIFTIDGRNLFDIQSEQNQFNYTSYYLIGSKEKKVLIPEILEHDKNNKKLKVSFDMDKLDIGNYHFVAKDISGKTSNIDEDSELIVKFKKPMDLDISAGYAFFMNIVDDTLPTYLQKKMFPTSATAKITFIPMKHRWGYLGIGVNGFYTRINAPVNNYVIDGNLSIANFNLVYQKPIYRQLSEKKRKHFMTFEARLGAGLTMFQQMAFHFPHNIDTPPLNSTSLNAAVGFSLQYYIFSRLFVEVNTDFVYSFVKDMRPGFFIPSLCIGWQL